MAAKIEKIVDGCMHIAKSLRLLPRFETTHSSFPYSGRLM
jgi:hypothetical protein